MVLLKQPILEFILRAGSYTNDDASVFNDYNLNDDPNGSFEGAVIQTNKISYTFFLDFFCWQL